MSVTKERRRFLAAGTLCLLSIGLSAFAAFIGLLFSGSPDISAAIGLLGTSAAVTLYAWPLASLRTEIVALAAMLLVIGLWLIWSPPGVSRRLRVGFLIAGLLTILAFISPQIARDVLGIV